MPTGLPPPCAQAGAEKASTAAIATPFKRCFMLMILCCSSVSAKTQQTQRTLGWAALELGRGSANDAGHRSVPVLE
jgi:hypothetical protein